jgi:hypothetical protein
VENIRILLGAMPPVIRDIVAEQVGRQHDMRIVGDVTAEGSLRSLVRRFEASVVILAVATSDVPAEVQDLVGERCGTKVLAVEADGRHAWLYELRPHQVRIGEVSPQTLIETIRAASSPMATEVHQS